MMRILVAINDDDILASFTAVNRGPTNGDPPANDSVGPHTYEWVDHVSEVKGSVVHVREEGWAVLAEIVLNDYMAKTEYEEVEVPRPVCPACGAIADRLPEGGWTTGHSLDCAWLNDPTSEPYS